MIRSLRVRWGPNMRQLVLNTNVSLYEAMLHMAQEAAHISWLIVRLCQTQKRQAGDYILASIILGPLEKSWQIEQERSIELPYCNQT